MNIGDRIKYLRKQKNLTQIEFGRSIGILGTAISLIEKGERNPSETVLLAITHEYGVNYGWLKLGHEPMMIPKESLDMASIEKIMTGDNEYVKAVFRELASMPEEWWKQAVEMLKRITAEEKDR